MAARRKAGAEGSEGGEDYAVSPSSFVETVAFGIEGSRYTVKVVGMGDLTEQKKIKETGEGRKKKRSIVKR